MHKERKDKHFIHKPVYPGGRSAMQAFVTQNLKYPSKALEQKIEGTVTLKYTIDYKGKVIDSQVISGLGAGCDEEAQRIVKLFKFDVAKSPKRKVLFHKDIHIHFKLPKKKPAAKTNISYVTTTKKKDGEPKGKPQSTSYHYTLTIPK